MRRIRSDSYMSETKLFCVAPILGALNEAKKFIEKIDGHAKIKSVSDAQKKFLLDFSRSIRGVDSLKELKSIANTDPNIINKWLKDNGFTIQVNAVNKSEISVASILKVLLEWQNIGEETVININDDEYRASKFIAGVSIYEDRMVHSYPLAELSCKGEYKAYIARTDIYPNNDREFSKMILRLKSMSSRDNRSENFDSIVFPNIKLRKTVDIGWIKKMMVGDSYYIKEALQEVVFEMDHIGAKAESAVALDVDSLDIPVDYIVDGPFIIWIEKKNLHFPLFAAVLDKDTWVRTAKDEDKDTRTRWRVDKINKSIKKLQEQIERCNDEIGSVQKECKHREQIRYPCPAGGPAEYQCCFCDKWV